MAPANDGSGCNAGQAYGWAVIWPMRLAAHERSVTGPEDEFDERCNGDPSSINGEDDESGFDDMPVENGWPDEPDEDEEDDE